MEAKLGPDHPDTLAQPQQPRRRLPGRRPAGRGDRAGRGDAQAAEAKLGPDHPDTLTSRSNLAATSSAGRWSEAEALRRETLGRRRKADKPDSPLLAGDLAGLGRNLLSSRSGRRPSRCCASAWRSTRRRAPTTGSASTR